MKRSGRAMSMPAGIAVGIAVSVGVILISTAILSWLVLGGHIREESIGYGVMVILVLSSCTGCLCAWKGIGHRRLLVTGICAIGLFAALMILGLAFGGVRHGIGTTGIMIGLGGGISFIPALAGNKSGGRKHRYRQFR